MARSLLVALTFECEVFSSLKRPYCESGFSSKDVFSDAWEIEL